MTREVCDDNSITHHICCNNSVTHDICTDKSVSPRVNVRQNCTLQEIVVQLLVFVPIALVGVLAVLHWWGYWL